MAHLGNLTWIEADPKPTKFWRVRCRPTMHGSAPRSFLCAGNDLIELDTHLQILRLFLGFAAFAWGIFHRCGFSQLVFRG